MSMKMEPNISPDFTVEDIRRVRDYYYEVTKTMTLEEERAYLDSIAAPGLAEIERRRKSMRRNRENYEH